MEQDGTGWDKVSNGTRSAMVHYGNPQYDQVQQRLRGISALGTCRQLGVWSLVRGQRSLVRGQRSEVRGKREEGGVWGELRTDDRVGLSNLSLRELFVLLVTR